MAWIQCNFFAESLGLNTSMNVILPQQTRGQIGMNGKAAREKHPVLWLLHGASDDDSIWMRRTSIERYVSELGLAVVMPQVHLSFYTDMMHGGKYGTFLMEELPELARSFFPLSAAREDNYVAGLSMGGYGAFKWALSKPEQIAAAAGLSTGNFALAGREDYPQLTPHFDLIYGHQPQQGTANDLYYLISSCAASAGPRPRFFQTCGTEDFLYEDNLKLKREFEQSGLDYSYNEEPGAHTWDFWDKKIQEVLSWLPLER